MRAAALSALLLAACGATGLPHGSTAAQCGTCHEDQHADWSATSHARSTRSPVFEALLPKVEAAWGATARARCVACHAPGFGGDDAIGCVTCHAAVGNRGAKDGALAVSLDAPLAGTKVVSNGFHEVEPRALLRSATLCATCHEVTGPALLDEPTATEFARTRFAAADDCVSCHLEAPGDGAARSHRLVGVDPAWGAGPVEQQRALAAAQRLWSRALTLEVTEAGGGVDVSLSNTGAAHAVPTGAAHLRDVWVDVELVDARGVRFGSARVIELGAKLTRGGQSVALVTDADLVEPRGLALDQRRTVHVAAPPEAVPPVRASATLWAQPVRAEALEALQLAARADEAPALRVATASAR